MEVDLMEGKLVIDSKVKEFVREKGGLSTGSDVYEALNSEVAHVLTKAIGRAQNNGRKTLMKGDL
jgi:hypothetical protein